MYTDEFFGSTDECGTAWMEPNTPLGQAYLIPYNNKGVMECQFQIGYKGLIDLSYRNPQMQIISAQAVYENDVFEYELGLNPKLEHRPALEDRGEVRLFYGMFKLVNGDTDLKS